MTTARLICTVCPTHTCADLWIVGGMGVVAAELFEPPHNDWSNVLAKMRRLATAKGYDITTIERREPNRIRVAIRMKPDVWRISLDHRIAPEKPAERWQAIHRDPSIAAGLEAIASGRSLHAGWDILPEVQAAIDAGLARNADPKWQFRDDAGAKPTIRLTLAGEFLLQRVEVGA